MNSQQTDGSTEVVVEGVGEEADVAGVNGRKKSRVLDPWVHQYADGTGLTLQAAQEQLIGFGFDPQSVGL